MDTISVDDMAKFICNKPDFASKLVNRIIDILKLNISDIGSLDVPDVEKKDNTDQKVKTNTSGQLEISIDEMKLVLENSETSYEIMVVSS